MVSFFSRKIGARTLTIETGKLARQANGAVLLRYGDSVVLVTATMGDPREGIDFFPLTIDFEERLYARGKIPGSFFRREGRPSTDAVLIDRLTDRPLRPLFPKGLRNEVQVIITPLSADLQNPLDILSLIGASTALCISDIPFEGPVSSTRVGYVDGGFVINPTFAEIEASKLDLVVAGTREGVLMLEAGATEASEAQVLEAIRIGQQANLQVIEFQEEIIAAVGKSKVAFTVATQPEGLKARVGSSVGGRLANAIDKAGGKADEATRLELIERELVAELSDEFKGAEVSEAFGTLLKEEIRGRILRHGQRPDGRGLTEIRPLSCEVGLLPRTHGSALFSRGETQVLGITTLGSVGDAQKLDTINPAESKRFLLHYNFPPYSTGEAKRISSPGRREIGHGALAERALVPVLPSEEEFPYTIRLVAEVMGSNGSTSMGSVCACTMSLMDAGVPIRAPVAGISIGLITGAQGKFATLTDIQGMEDHLGDMDFKVAGTAQGITAVQLDIKVRSISFEIIEAALRQAREARMVILRRMAEAISGPRSQMSAYAPKMLQIKIPVEKIGTVIGPGGKMIRSIIEQTGATVDVRDDGTVTIGSPDGEAAQKAVKIIEDMTRAVQVGDIFTGKVVRIMAFGAFVEVLPGRDGLVHISELAEQHVPTVEDVVALGDEITVIVKEIDSMGRINLSRRALLERSPQTQDGVSGPNGAPAGAEARPEAPRTAGSHGGGPPRRRPQGGQGRGPGPRGPRTGGYREGPRFGGNRPPR